MNVRKVEWVTVGLIFGTMVLWGVTTTVLAAQSLGTAIVVTAVLVALHASLQHEVIHGHPTRWRWLNQAMVFPALTLAIPFIRFRDSHIAHHRDALLTDPYDDPESHFLDAGVWETLGWPARAVLSVNNTLAGRLLIGPLLAQGLFMAADFRAWRAGDNGVLRGWLWHVPAAVLVLGWLHETGAMPVWAYAISAYAGISILKIRTFAEHQAHEMARGRTVIIEDKGPLAFLFLNNNLHAVHHVHPDLPWYALPARYARNRAAYLARNDGYRFGSYGEVFARYLWRAKDPVAHPLWRRDW